MDEYDAVPFALWSLLTAALMGIAAFSYRAYAGRGRGGGAPA